MSHVDITLSLIAAEALHVLINSGRYDRFSSVRIITEDGNEWSQSRTPKHWNIPPHVLVITLTSAQRHRMKFTPFPMIRAWLRCHLERTTRHDAGPWERYSDAFWRSVMVA